MEAKVVKQSYSKSVGKTCAVVGCNNNQKTLWEWNNAECEEHGELHNECPCLLPFTFHYFPSDLDKRLAWQLALNRKGFTAKKYDVVCSHHFIEGRPTKAYPTPAENLGYENQTKANRKPPAKRKHLDTLHSNKKPFRNAIPDSPAGPLLEIDTNTEDEESNLTSEPHVKPTTTSCCTCSSCSCQCHTTHDVGIQAFEEIGIDHSYCTAGCMEQSTTSSETTGRPSMSFSDITSDSDCIFYTGLGLEMFGAVRDALKPVWPIKAGTMTMDDHLLLIMMRLRMGLYFQDLGHRFCISMQLASYIFRKAVPVMANLLKDGIIWLPRETIRASLPKAFMEKYPHTTCIIDCTEIFIQRPSSLLARAQTYSNYKGHNTAKCLVCIAPNGLIMYISQCYGGRASDNYITKNCGFLEYLLPGDEVMADRGFTISEDLFARRVKLNIPPFMKGKAQLSEEEAIATRRIASVRIHVERAIQRLKSFKIFDKALPSCFLDIIDDMLVICAALCNFRSPLIKGQEDL